MNKLIGGLIVAVLAMTSAAYGGELYEMRHDAKTRWISFENPTGAPGEGGKENKGAKGHAFDSIDAGQTRVLLDVKGSGTIRRMWFTLNDRKPEMLRSLVIRMYWDGAETPAVEAPFGDFFCAILGRLVPYENELYSSPEGRSFNCYIPMPFRTGAKITITNEADTWVEKLFYDIDYLLEDEQPDNALYFHAHWRRDRATELANDFEILPRVSGAGRFLGAHVGVITHPENKGWWGEGEVKMYMDGDTDFPTIIGTGTEDYIGTGWGQGTYHHRYQGSLVADGKKGLYGFYRYHIPDPIYFHEDIRVTIQQMGGAGKRVVLKLLEEGVEVKPVSLDYDEKFLKWLDQPEGSDLAKHDSPDDAWTNMYRRDDFSALALFYLDAPENGLPRIAAVAERTEGLEGNTE